MYRQLPLWFEAQDPNQEVKVWQQLDPETRRVIIATLSRLISKAVSPDNLPDSKEATHERQ
jgi:hypothetical protein